MSSSHTTCSHVSLKMTLVVAPESRLSPLISHGHHTIITCWESMTVTLTSAYYFASPILPALGIAKYLPSMYVDSTLVVRNVKS